MSGSQRSATVVPLRQPRERWLTFAEAADALDREYGIRTTPRSLEKLANHGKALKSGGAPMPSAINFGKRQVQLSRILPWLHDHGYIAEEAA